MRPEHALASSAALALCVFAFREIRKMRSLPSAPEGVKLKSGGETATPEQPACCCNFSCEIVAETLLAHGIKHVFVLSGGHVAPVYVAAEKLGMRVIDVRHEVNTVFAADAMWRLTGTPGVAIVTAGPGVTNTITAVC
ncbi:thiamine pyrophosphate enzyme, N-terminal TPP binding domain-containing protein [Baffinella frigidus]|nr:thiamine pyrophosphate enzyme, N-terminal TPP binding domain-containing protein [Cryptophyta sp. CCMP2293]